MHRCDAASKILMETRRYEMVRYFGGIDFAKSGMIEKKRFSGPGGGLKKNAWM